MTPADLFDRAGRALFGEHYRAPMDAALDLKSGRSKDWSNGRGEPPPGVWRQILTMLEDRERELAAVKDNLFLQIGRRAFEGQKPPNTVSRSFDIASSAGHASDDEITDPRWGDAGKVHDWRNHVAEEVRAIWSTFTVAQRQALFQWANELADNDVLDAGAPRF